MNEQRRYQPHLMLKKIAGSPPLAGLQPLHELQVSGTTGSKCREGIRWHGSNPTPQRAECGPESALRQVSKLAGRRSGYWPRALVGMTAMRHRWKFNSRPEPVFRVSRYLTSGEARFHGTGRLQGLRMVIIAPL